MASSPGAGAAAAAAAGGAPVPTAAEELAGLDKVLLRLGLTEDDKLEKVNGE